MNNKEHLHLLQYWRNTLADASRVEIEVDKTIFEANATIDYQSGKVLPEQATTLITVLEKQLNEGKGRFDPKDREWENLWETQVLIAPFRVSPLPEYAKLSGETGIFYPFWIRAILNKEGILKTDEDSFPYIPRTYLEPQINQDVNFIFSDVDKIDLAFAKTFVGNGTWADYWTYVKNTFADITGINLEQYAAEGFISTYQNTIVVNETITNASDGIIQLYDYLIHHKEVPPLLEKLCKKDDEKLKPLLSATDFENASAKHTGQMGYEYSLSVSQRKSVYHYNTQVPGDILAVNGPPGTGKTTLLQSIVANKVVDSAIAGKDPAVILACSTNNQAVRNIIDSFSNVKQKQGSLYERWLPDLKGFGLYLPRQSFDNTERIPVIKRLQGKLSGDHTDKENKPYLVKAEKQFISSFEKYSGKQGLSLKDIAAGLQKTIKAKQQQLEKGIQLWQQYKKINKLIKQLEPESALFTGNELNKQNLDHIESTVKEIENKVADYLDKEPFWIKLLSFLKFVKEKRMLRFKQLFRDCPVSYDTLDFYHIHTFHQFFDEKLGLIKQIKQFDTAWNSWKTANQIKGNPPVTDTGFKTAEKNREVFFYDELEKGLKYDMFYLAIHYWEARWILAASDALAADKLDKNGIANAKERWQRFTMLTPCFVSTFYMAPKYFTYSKFIGKTGSKNVYEAPPLLDFIDLLIVDEAGQVSPEIGAATFALAKQALVVGDTQQIEPVWSVPKKVDHANLHRYKLIDDTNDQTAIGELLQKGFLSSSGSIMKLAQKASHYHLYPETERGMLLTEHRRCFDEIIQYCNNLAYNGLLEPKKGPAKNTLFPPMQFIDVAGNSKIAGTSRTNAEEALSIAQWLLSNQQQIIQHCQNIENAEAQQESRPAKQLHLADIIGIITPFTGQKFTLKNMLKKSGIDTAKLTIGTVHTLQGAERSIIIFSSTYGLNDAGKGYFFDSGVNMLNVAVSRAKEAFIFFGNRANFDKRGNSPSNQLYKHIKSL